MNYAEVVERWGAGMAMDGTTTGAGAIEDVADGQRLIIFAILLQILTAIFMSSAGEIFGLLGIGSIVLAIVGLLRLADGLGYSTGIKVLLVVLVFMPLVSLVMLVIVNGKATEALKAAGYKVGLFGARKP